MGNPNARAFSARSSTTQGSERCLGETLKLCAGMCIPMHLAYMIPPVCFTTHTYA
jgi:hypothetical protein